MRSALRGLLVGTAAALAFAVAFVGRLAAVSLDESGTRQPPRLTTVTCQIQSNGIVRHVMDGTYPGLHPTRVKTPYDVPLTVVGTWNPSTKVATEYISWTGDIGIRPMPADNDRWGAGTLSCPSDPWMTVVACTPTAMQNYYKSMAVSEGGHFPVSSAFLDAADRLRIKQACLHPIPSKKPPATPDSRLLVSNAQLPQPCKLCTGAPYGATYAGGVPGNLKGGTMIAVPITVTNTGCMEWPGQSITFHLSNHWFQGATEITLDGLRTVLPRRICPGETVQMMGSLQIPTAPGTYTLKWDLVYEGVAWFSNKGVPTHDVAVTVK